MANLLFTLANRLIGMYSSVTLYYKEIDVEVFPVPSKIKVIWVGSETTYLYFIHTCQNVLYV